MDEQEKLIDAWADECRELQNEQPVMVSLDPLIVIAIISQIQLASRHPENTGWMMSEATAAARSLQSLFSPTSVTNRVLELGWNADEDITLQRSDRHSDLWKFNGGIKPKFWFGDQVKVGKQSAVILGMDWIADGWWYLVLIKGGERLARSYESCHESCLSAIAQIEGEKCQGF